MRYLHGLVVLALLVEGSAARALECEVPTERRLERALVVGSNLVGPGLVNSLAGLTWIVGSFLTAPFSTKVQIPRFRIARSGFQINVTVGNDWYEHATSLGLFLIEGRDLEEYWAEETFNLHLLHEAGHARQSALLGPLYLPFAAVDYAIHRGGNHHVYFRRRKDRGGFSRDPEDEAWIETWADTIAASGGARDQLSSRDIQQLIGCQSPVDEPAELLSNSPAPPRRAGARHSRDNVGKRAARRLRRHTAPSGQRHSS